MTQALPADPERPDADLAPVTRAVNRIPAMIAYWDRDARNRFANAAYRQWFGMTPEQLRGKHISELLGDRLYHANLPYITGALAGEEQMFERTLVDTLGRTRYTQAQYFPDLDADGRVQGFAVLVTDITRRVLAEIELQQARAHAEVLTDRERIAADLHDNVIQRLYAVGMGLHTMSATVPPEAAERLSRSVDALDRTIRSLRETIRPLVSSERRIDLRAEVDRVLAESTTLLGFTPTLTWPDPPELVPADAVPDLLAVLREALSNAARHARASNVAVTITTLSGETRLIVEDDGIGIGTTDRISGLGTMCRRAERHGGAMHVHPNRPHGTLVDWRIPTAPVT